MQRPATISSESLRDKKNLYPFVALMVVSLLTGTFLRISLVITYPFLAGFVLYYYRLKLSKPFLWLVIVIAAGCIFSFSEGMFLKYKLLSLFYMIPFLALLFARPSADHEISYRALPVFMQCLTMVAIVNDITGLVQVYRNPYSDDSFTGIYSEYSLSLNGLVLLNAILAFYYLVRYIYSGRIFLLSVSIFFLFCSILGFYGAGLVVFTAACVISFFQLRLKSVLRTAGIAFLALAVIYFFMMAFKPFALEYNISNVKKIISFNTKGGARKPKIFRNYALAYPPNTKDFLFGSGPGTFNSRTAFMVGSPSYFSKVSFIKDTTQPYYFKNYAYTLWNDSNTMKSFYLDGFRNQPFSSLLAFLGEYGLIFSLLFGALYFRYYQAVAQLYELQKTVKNAAISFRFFKFSMLLLPLLLLIDNYFEYPEIMLLVLLSIKFSHASLLNTTTTTHGH